MTGAGGNNAFPQGLPSNQVDVSPMGRHSTYHNRISGHMTKLFKNQETTGLQKSCHTIPA